MAIININANNVENVKFLRNGNLYATANAAKDALLGFDYSSEQDGTAILARYSGETDQQVAYYRTMVGFVFVSGATKSVTILDVEGAQADVDALREEMRAKFGNGVTESNSVTSQLQVLSGGTFTPGTSSSADTSVEGAKAYAYDLIGTLEYTDTAVAGQYVSEVDQVDGKIAVTRVELPSSADTAVAKKFVTSVAEDKGQIVVSRGEISSSAETIVLADNADGGVNFEVNIDGASIVQDPTSKKIKVADSALTQYFGDEKTIHAEIDAVTNKKTFNTLLQISATTPSETNVKEQYNLVNASGETIGATIKIYKDSSLYNVYLGHVDDTIAGDPPVVTSGTGDTALCFIYHKEDGSYELVPVNVETFLEESEFESGVTATNHIVHGVVDPASEKDSQETPVDFLTVGANGFKISGIKDEIGRELNAIVDDLDATVTGATSGNHVTISIEELDGKLVQSGLTIQENDIASETDLNALSAKTITDVKSANGSVTVTPANAADGTKEIDLATDASKIQMSGFTSTTASSLNGISESDSVTEAFEEVQDVIDGVNDRIDDLENDFVSGVTVNGTSVVTDHVGAISISGGTSAATSSNAVVVETDTTTGAITISLGTIDCGTY